MAEKHAARARNGKFEATVDSAQQVAEALRLRGLGWTLRQIAAEQGINESTAHTRIMRGLAAIQGEGADAARRLELERIDGFLRLVNEIIAAPGPAVDRMGHPLLGDDGQPLPNRDIQLSAIDRGARLLERRGRVMGTDAPRRSVHVTFRSLIESMPPGEIEAELSRMRLEAGSPLTEDDRARLGLPPAAAGELPAGTVVAGFALSQEDAGPARLSPQNGHAG